MPELTTLEYTGERVIPGLVDPNLLNEHLARYHFAAHFVNDAAVLDAGCGSGYGTAQLAGARFIAAVDVSAEAIRYARTHFARVGVHFFQAACESLPFAAGSFDAVLAFEVIEHLDRWREMLCEVRRVLKPSGVLLVSTPNKAYYTESRAAAGPNPFHLHEFDLQEFRAALGSVFGHVHIWTQNHAESIAFVPESGSYGEAAVEAAGDPSDAHFFLAACSESPITGLDAFAWIPSGGNILRERERHIRLLESEIAQKNDWLKELEQRHAALQNVHEEQNEWARRLEQELKDIHTGYQDKIAAWTQELESQIERGRNEIARLDRENEEYRRSIAATTERLEADKEELRSRIRLIGASRWIRLGRTLGVGPEVKSPVVNGSE